MTEETYNLLEEAAQVQLRQVTKIDPETKEGKDHLAKSIHLVELLTTPARIMLSITTSRNGEELKKNEMKP